MRPVLLLLLAAVWGRPVSAQDDPATPAQDSAQVHRLVARAGELLMAAGWPIWRSNAAISHRRSINTSTAWWCSAQRTIGNRRPLC
ncbi:MAG: hypothetical protein ABI599_02235 [Flavobacteriales bacterium]